MQSDSFSPVNDADTLRSTQDRRDRLGLLDPKAEGALWHPGPVPAESFWRTLCIRHLKQQDQAYDQVEQRLSVLAEAVLACANPAESTRGQPPLIRVTFKNLAKLPAFTAAPCLTADQWARLAYAQALRALLELAILNTTRKEYDCPKSGFTLREAFARAFSGFKVQVAAGFLPSNTEDAVDNSDWDQAQQRASQYLKNPDFFNKNGWNQPEYVMRSLVEFIVAYSGLFEEKNSHKSAKTRREAADSNQAPQHEATTQRRSDVSPEEIEFSYQNDDDDGEAEDSCAGDDDASEDSDETSVKNKSQKNQRNDVATKIIRLTEQGWALLRFDNEAVKVMTGNHPMLVKPNPWKYGQRGGRKSAAAHLCKSTALNATAADVLQLMERSEMPVVFQAINQLQNTAWRINQRVLSIAQAIYLGTDDQDLPSAIQALRIKAKEETDPVSTEWVQKERLDPNHSHWYSSLDDLKGRSAFYYPYQLDYRGRIYPQAGWLSPQGDDLAKALLEFANGKPIRPEDAGAEKFLARYGAQLATNTGITNPTLDACSQWSRDHSKKIEASARNPLRHDWWLTHAKPGTHWQMLAFCCAWFDMKQGKPVHLPVQVDGSCNGLQHMAALLRDKEMAQYTNLLGNGEKKDLYTWILQGVQQGMEQSHQDETKADQPLAAWICVHGKNILSRDIVKKVVMTFSYGSTIYKDKLYEHLEEQLLIDWHNPVPNAPADTEAIEAAASDVGSWFTAVLQAKDKGYKFPRAEHIHGWCGETSQSSGDKRLTRQELTVCITAHNSQQPVPEGLHEKMQRFLRDRLASFLADCFEVVMNDRLKNAVQLQNVLKDWSGNIAKATGLPPVWVTPAQYPVIQLKKENINKEINQKRREIKNIKERKDIAPEEIKKRIALIHEKLKKLEDKIRKDKLKHVLDWNGFAVLSQTLPESFTVFIDLKGKDGLRQIPREQRPFFLDGHNAQKAPFPPNFIHSLDAAHLMLTINRCRQLGIEDFVAVHDSFGTHACDVAKLGRALRDSFMQLHHQPLLAQCHAWLQHLADLAQNPTGSPPLLPTEYSDMQAAVLGLMRDHWLAVKPQEKTSTQPVQLQLPPEIPQQQRFDIDAIGKSDYIFF